MKNFHDDTPGQKFIAIFSDGSGCKIFERVGNKFRSPQYDNELPDHYWFADAGYLWFIDLPDDFEVWKQPPVA